MANSFRFVSIRLPIITESMREREGDRQLRIVFAFAGHTHTRTSLRTPPTTHTHT